MNCTSFKEQQNLPTSSDSCPEAAKTMDTEILYTVFLFISALELAAREQNEEALAAAKNLNTPHAALIKAIVSHSVNDILIAENRSTISDAWLSLVDFVMSYCSEYASSQFALLSPIVTDNNARLQAGQSFYDGNLYQGAAHIWGTIPADSPLADMDFFHTLGISLYRSGDYRNSAIALITAARLGDISQETLSYLTWLEERLRGQGGSIS